MDKTQFIPIMSNNIDLKRGLDIPISGTADLVVAKRVVTDRIAVKPSDFKGLLPRLLVREGDAVLAGSPLMADKKNPDILVTSPVSGTVSGIVRGEKRKLLAVIIAPAAKQEAIDFGARDIDALGAQEVREALLKSGLWTALIQRPYGIVADPAASPKAIFVSMFSTAPLAADTTFTLGSEKDTLQAGLTALGKLTDGPVHVCVDREDSPFAGFAGVETHVVTGRHPAGNVGIQISHISPIAKDEKVWTVSPALVSAIGKLFRKGTLNLWRKVAVCGPAAIQPSYIEALPGTPMTALGGFYGTTAAETRFISGDVLSGTSVGEDGFLGFFDSQITLIREGRDEELFGWLRPFRIHQYSCDRTYFNWCLGWLTPKRRYDMDTNLHGGPRAFVMNDSYYAKVLPMDIYPLYLTKACLAGDIEKMEQFGIYEVLPEDLATCEFIDPSKNNIQSYIADGIDLMLKEMA